LLTTIILLSNFKLQKDFAIKKTDQTFHAYSERNSRFQQDFMVIFFYLFSERLKRNSMRTQATQTDVNNVARCWFHQHFTSSFFVRKCFAKLFSNYSLALKFFDSRISAQKLLIKCWWNWLQESSLISHPNQP